MEIVINDLTKEYNNNKILNDINIEFKSKNVYGIVGRNGSGKTVLLKIICGFIKPNKGEVIVDGENIFKNDFFLPNARVMIEHPTFIGELSGLENLKLLAAIQNKITTNDIIEWLKKVGLTNDMNKKYQDYSLGMKQKLGIVQVLMENPDILILDEPFNGLDKGSYEQMMKIFDIEKEKGKLIIIATHIESDLKNLCNKIYEIDNGNILLKS